MLARDQLLRGLRRVLHMVSERTARGLTSIMDFECESCWNEWLCLATEIETPRGKSLDSSRVAGVPMYIVIL